MDYFDEMQEGVLFPYVDQDVDICEYFEDTDFEDFEDYDDIEDCYDDWDDVGNYDIYFNDWEG
jgi:hypothetical protein